MRTGGCVRLTSRQDTRKPSQFGGYFVQGVHSVGGNGVLGVLLQQAQHGVEAPMQEIEGAAGLIRVALHDAPDPGEVAPADLAQMTRLGGECHGSVPPSWR
jgi:hypothetical protein